jgi:hypothetical protein
MSFATGSSALTTSARSLNSSEDRRRRCLDTGFPSGLPDEKLSPVTGVPIRYVLASVPKPSDSVPQPPGEILSGTSATLGRRRPPNFACLWKTCRQTVFQPVRSLCAGMWTARRLPPGVRALCAADLAFRELESPPGCGGQKVQRLLGVVSLNSACSYWICSGNMAFGRRVLMVLAERRSGLVGHVASSDSARSAPDGCYSRLPRSVQLPSAQVRGVPAVTSVGLNRFGTPPASLFAVTGKNDELLGSKERI